MTQQQDLWVILDLRGLVLQCYHSGTDVETGDAKIKSPEHTLDNFITRYLEPLTKLVPLNHIIAVKDGGNFYRKKLNPNYKANRDASETDPQVKLAIEVSIQAVRELLHSLGIMQCYAPLTEADDTIAYLNQQLPGRKLIYTVDGDLIALTSQHTTVFQKGDPAFVYKYKYDKTVDGKKTRQTLQILPKHVTLFKSIVGDSSDKIAGVNGAGPDFWVKLRDEFDLDGLDELAALAENEEYGKLKAINEQVKSPLLDKLVKNLSQWRNSYMLARLTPELINSRQEKQFTRIKWEKRLPSKERLLKLAQTARAQWLPMDLGHLLPFQQLVTAQEWDDTVLDDLEQMFKASRFVALDWETWSPTHEPFEIAGEGRYVDMLSSRITGMGITCGENLEHTFYFQFEHADEHNNLPKKHLLDILARIPAGMPIVAQHAIFERTVLLNELGYDLPDLHDTKIMASHVDEGMPSGLKEMSKNLLNYNQMHYNDVIAKGMTMKDYTGAHVFQYGADDPLVTGHLYDMFRIVLLVEGTWDFVRENEFPVVYQLSDAFIAGVDIDYEEVERQRAEDQVTYDAHMRRIRELLEANVNAETIESGARNWMDEEETLIIEAERRYVLKTVTELFKRPDFMELAKQDKLVNLWLGESLVPGLALTDYLEAIADMAVNLCRRIKGPKGKPTPWEAAVEGATYKPFHVETTPAKLMFIPAHLNQLAELHGLPNWPEVAKGDDVVAAMRAHIDQLPELTSDQKHFTDMVIQAAAFGKERTKSEQYKFLSDLYAQSFNTTKAYGTELNLDSPKQMQYLLYAMLGLPIRVRAFEPSKGRAVLSLAGAPQTNKDAIAAALAHGDATGWKKEVLELVTEAKAAMTRIKIFYNKFPLWQHPIDGLIHPQFNSTGTGTRRPSGSSPNLLQLSKKGEGVKVRRCIRPNRKLGHNLIVAIDWAAQELRVIAALSGDENMIACYVGDNLLDIHSMTAAYMLDVSYADFVAIRKGRDGKEMAKLFDDARKAAKNVNFGSSYGIGKNKLARQLVLGSKQVVSPDKAGAFLEAKKAAFPGVESWKDRVKESLHATGIVKTQFGTIKHVYDKLLSKDDGLVSYYERASVNQLIQGVCADYLKKVLSDLWRKRTFLRHNAVLVAPIYDELVFSCHHSQAASLILEVYGVMTQGIPGISIPMLANPSLGPNFGDQTEVLADENETLTEELIQAAMVKALGQELLEAA